MLTLLLLPSKCLAIAIRLLCTRHVGYVWLHNPVKPVAICCNGYIYSYVLGIVQTCMYSVMNIMLLKLAMLIIMLSSSITVGIAITIAISNY